MAVHIAPKTINVPGGKPHKAVSQEATHAAPMDLFAARMTAMEALWAPFSGGIHGDGEGGGTMSVGWQWPSRRDDWTIAAKALRDMFDNAVGLVKSGGADAKRIGTELLNIVRDTARDAWKQAKDAGDKAADDLLKLYREAQQKAIFTSQSIMLLAGLALLYFAKRRG